jgi:hypothetical protein
MKLGKPILLVTTPIGLGIGLYEGYKLTGGMVVLVFALMAFFGVAIITVVSTIRREQAAQQQADAAKKPD